MKVFILAGGYGTRLFPFTELIPKCLLPIKGKPVVRYIIENLISQGFKDIVLCINKKFSELFLHEFRDLDIEFSISEKPLGTAGEIFIAKKFIDDKFMVIYGDDLTFLDYSKLLEFHNVHKDAIASIVATSNVPLEFGVIIEEDDKVKIFKEKPNLGLLIWTGTAIFEPEALMIRGVFGVF